VAQLEEEGSIQVLYAVDGAREPILAAVGELQFDVTAARLRDEYGVTAVFQRLGYESAWWAEGVSPRDHRVSWPSRDVLRTEDRNGRLVALFGSSWVRRYAQEQNPDVVFRPLG
jgi:peptide chain release factor 3